MTKRVTNPPVRTLLSPRGSLLRNALGLRTLLTCTVVALALGGGATSTHALNGERPDFEGTFSPACQDLRTATGLPGGDEIFACDSDGEQCRLFSSVTETDEGVANGFCRDRTLEIVPYRGGPIEKNTGIQATSFGSDIGVAGATGAIGHIFCDTFGTPSPGKKVCVNVFESDSGDCTGNCDTTGIVVRRDATCTAVRALLAASVTSDRFQNLAWWLFIDSEKTGQSNSEVLSVCPGFAWRFLDLSEAIAHGVTVTHQLGKERVQTPHYVTISGRRFCKVMTGEITPPHCR